MNTGWARRWGGVALEALEKCQGLTLQAHPLAMAATAVQVAKVIRADVARKGRAACWAVDERAAQAVAAVATLTGLGRVQTDGADGKVVRVHEGCEWGSHGWWTHGPYGDGQVLARHVWEALGTAVMACTSERWGGDRLALLRDPAGPGAPSRRADRIAQEAGALREHRAPVGILLHGPPGTGKTEIACAVARQLGGFSLRVQLAAAPPQAVMGLVEILAPRAVIADDVDRGQTSQALDLAAQLTARGVVMIVTANVVDDLDPALVRARRLGLHYEIGALDDEELLDATPGISAEERQCLRGRTIAEVTDYLDHRAALGPVRARELLQRQLVPDGVHAVGHARAAEAADREPQL